MYNARVNEGDYSGVVVIKEPIGFEQLKAMPACWFGDMAKAVVDVRLRLIALGAELHADEERVLIESGSEPQDLWGINIYVDRPKSEWVEFDSMINIRPSQGNRSRYVEDAAIRQNLVDIVNSLIE